MILRTPTTTYSMYFDLVPVLSCTLSSLFVRGLQLLYHSLMTKLSTPPFLKIIYKLLKKHITLLTYLLPCPAARVP